MKRRICSSIRRAPMFVVYASGTESANGRALYWMRGEKPKFTSRSNASIFSKSKAEAICNRNQNGKYTWVKDFECYNYSESVQDPYGYFSGNAKASPEFFDEFYESLE